MKAPYLQLNGNKFLLLFFILLHIPNFSSAQKKKIGTLEYLKYSNGIQGLTLGADINTLNYSNLKYLDDDNKFDADSCLKFAIGDTTVLKINGDLNLDLIGIRTYKNKIVNIYLFFRKTDAYILLHNFLSTYGVFTSKPVEYSNMYNWDSGTVSLSLMYQADVDDGVAVFTCNPLVHRIAEVKELAAMKEKTKTNDKSTMLFSSTNP
ncbi:hypothetical protein [Mucilaginibacter flavidus]|uniref:hypothetical protein n=1 Tax=Mucilaginibacter flavidus TaxID=2949309 RepID=UPI0020926F9B|nr:hypothetical protein [Mucilaginibacter flavidus]MCO5948021.1 hypothetical protein [Mucilaginibacter flavidus]